MKKILSLLLCLAMLLTLGLTAMGQAEDGGELRVSLCIAETLGDLGFYDSANEGLKRLEADYGVIGSVVECKSDASMYQVALVEAAEQSDVVVAVGWQFWDGLTAVAPEMPDTKFIFVDNGLDGVGDNLLSITYAENEGSFLAGYVAMKLAQSGIVGVIGGENSDTINNFVVGYKQGALYANPDGTVLDPVYTDDYEAPDKGKEAALSLYSQGADVVYAVAGKTGLGVFEAAQEQGKYAVGVDSDQKYINPDVIICSMLKRVGNSVYDVISNYLEDGVFDGGTIWNADMSSGLVGLGYGDDTMTQQVSDELKAEVEALAEKIIAGEIEDQSTHTTTMEKIKAPCRRLPRKGPLPNGGDAHEPETNGRGPAALPDAAVRMRAGGLGGRYGGRAGRAHDGAGRGAGICGDVHRQLGADEPCGAHGGQRRVRGSATQALCAAR